MRQKHILLLFTSLCLTVLGCQKGGSSGSDGTVQILSHSCKTIALSTRPLTYCYQPRANQNHGSSPAVVYFFHGIGGSAEDLFSGPSADVIRKVQSSLGPLSPLFIGLSLGPEGIAVDDANEIVSTALPQIEARFHIDSSSALRSLMGASMGGHNVLRVAAANPALFRSVAALCPALITFDPFDKAQTQAYVDRHESDLDLPFFQYVLGVFQKQFPTEENWQANNPFQLLNQGNYDNLHLFISVGDSDSLGFEEGAYQFWSQAHQVRHISAQWAPAPGGHCSFDSQALLQFYSYAAWLP